MERLIKAEKLKEIISDTWILNRIDEQPTVDAVEVVRCKNCDNYSEYTFNGQIHGVGFCDEWDGFTKETGYCHKADKIEK